jgi:hypothetical protein
LVTDRAQRFTSRHEAEAARPRLKPDNPVPLVQFAYLIGDYQFPKPEWVRCQLIDQQGKCKKNHGRGWIVQLTDDSEGYIGHQCADDHFGKDSRYAGRFAAAKARVSREIETDLLVGRLKVLLEDVRIAQTLNAALRRREQLSERVTQIRDLLRPKLFQALTDRSKRGDTQVLVRVLYEEEEVDEGTGQKRKVLRPQALRWGALVGLESLDYRPLLRIGARLKEAEAALSQAVASVDQPLRQMQKWAAALEYVPRADAELDKHDAPLRSFCQPDNVKLLWLLAKDRFGQLAAVNAALEIATRKRISEKEAETTRDVWRQEIRATHGRDFEVIGDF